MIIEWKQDRLLLLPALSGASSTTRRLLGGINEVDNDYWARAKAHKSIQRHIEAGNLVEIVQSSIPTKKSKMLDAEIDKVSAELLLKKEELKQNKKQLKKSKKIEDKESKKVEIAGLEEEVKELEESLISAKTQRMDELYKFSSLPHKEQTELINNSFDIQLLKRWAEDDNRATVRNIILNRIDALKKPMTKDGM